MSETDRIYYLSRAEAELALALGAAHPAAMRAHYHLAGFYLDRTYGLAAEQPVRARLVLVTSSTPVQAA